jgi:hypothetical protein
MVAMALCCSPRFYPFAHDDIKFDAFSLFLRKVEEFPIFDQEVDVFSILDLIPVVVILGYVGLASLLGFYFLRFFFFLFFFLRILGDLSDYRCGSLGFLFVVPDLKKEIHCFFNL